MPCYVISHGSLLAKSNCQVRNLYQSEGGIGGFMLSAIYTSSIEINISTSKFCKGSAREPIA
ncbi:uncharacterized protein DS421_6g174140 [Arachis hypogaea]|nr:uncharacterized protein DS421_6g174140 [Arachis hypogaea]